LEFLCRIFFYGNFIREINGGYSCFEVGGREAYDTVITGFIFRGKGGRYKKQNP
jgi:hypothetical protein